MSQEIFDSIDPAISGIELADVLNDFKDALMTNLSGTSRPAELQQGGGWLDTTDPTNWIYKIWSGTDDISVFTLNLSTNIASVALAVEQFSIKKVSADTTAAILNLIKQRIDDNGQVKSGDVVGEIRFTGRTDTAGNPVVAKMIWTADEDQTDTQRGGTFSIQSIPLGGAALVEYVKFYQSITEMVLPLRLNSVRYASQTLTTDASSPTTGEIALNTDFSLLEVAGSFDLLIRGINATGKAREITVHNRSSMAVTLKHADGAATANNRLDLPNSEDYAIGAKLSATLYYSSADSRWKLKSVSDKNFSGFTVTTFKKFKSLWTAPVTTSKVRVRSYKKFPGFTEASSQLIDSYGYPYAWGLNNSGQLGNGNVTPQSSPIAVTGGLNFIKIFGGLSQSRFGIAARDGRLYAWGNNGFGCLGDNTVAAKSSPVAVSSSLSFVQVISREGTTLAMTNNGTPYAWGNNTKGMVGDGSTTMRSVPVAVAGNLKFLKIALGVSTASQIASGFGITKDGVMYAWGDNANGQLGVGDLTARSSPVAVLGGLSCAEVVNGAASAQMFTAALTQAGEVYAWGDNSQGQLGLGDITTRSSPIMVLGGNVFDRIYAHNRSGTMYAQKSDGSLYAWGGNGQGQMGDGTSASKSSPIAVVGALTFDKFKVFGDSAYGLLSDGTAYAWGANAHGQLGVGDIVSRSSPVAVLGGLKFVDLFCAEGTNDFYSIYGITRDGNIYAWGRNTNGTLGVGDVASRSSPVAVLGAMAPNTLVEAYEITLTVTPGQSYPVVVSEGMSYFGSQALGTNVEKIEVESL